MLPRPNCFKFWDNSKRFRPRARSRAYAKKFLALEEQGIRLFPQDGSE